MWWVLCAYKVRAPNYRRRGGQLQKNSPKFPQTSLKFPNPPGASHAPPTTSRPRKGHHRLHLCMWWVLCAYKVRAPNYRRRGGQLQKNSPKLPQTSLKFPNPPGASHAPPTTSRPRKGHHRLHLCMWWVLCAYKVRAPNYRRRGGQLQKNSPKFPQTSLKFPNPPGASHAPPTTSRPRKGHHRLHLCMWWVLCAYKVRAPNYRRRGGQLQKISPKFPPASLNFPNPPGASHYLSQNSQLPSGLARGTTAYICVVDAVC